MPVPRSYRCEGIVLEARPQAEADLAATLITADHGKLRVVARGARKPTSRLVGHLVPLNRVQVALARGRGPDYVTQAQVVESFQDLKASLDRVSQGLYLAELVHGFSVEGVANPAIYALLVDTLRSLPSSSAPDLASRYFEIQLLKTSGFAPELYQCVECHLSLTPGEHRFSPGVGGALCPKCRPAGVQVMSLSVEALKVLRFLDRVQLEDVERLRLEPAHEEEVKSLLLAVLTYWLDRQIWTAHFLEHLERTRGVAV